MAFVNKISIYSFTQICFRTKLKRTKKKHKAATDEDTENSTNSDTETNTTNEKESKEESKCGSSI